MENNVNVNEVFENKIKEMQNKIDELQKKSEDLETKKTNVKVLIDLVTDVFVSHQFKIESKKDCNEIEYSGTLNLDAIREVIKFIPEIA